MEADYSDLVKHLLDQNPNKPYIILNHTAYFRNKLPEGISGQFYILNKQEHDHLLKIESIRNKS